MAFALCPICKKSKRVTDTGKMARHRMQASVDERGIAVMVDCIGKGEKPDEGGQSVYGVWRDRDGPRMGARTL